ncbi:MAG TPA: phosphodiester glycosidase family protein [Gaiella sp.]
MRRLAVTFLVSLVATALLAPTGHAAPRELWPGVTYETDVQFTPHGPVAINVLRGPRPGGLTSLEPVVSNDTIVGRETLTSMQRRLQSSAATAGINGDFFALATGRPSGMVMREGQLLAPPNGSRASAGITTDGTLDVRRVGFSGSWDAGAGPHVLSLLNAAPKVGRVALFTDAYGPATPPIAGSAAAILFPFPDAIPSVGLSAPVAELRSGSSPVAIPAGGAVLLARGAAASILRQEASVGAPITIGLSFKPDWPGIVAAVGGGPQIVRAGAPVFRAGESFTTNQLGQRAPRSAVGQLADGRIVLVAVDGRQPGYSVGLTNFELAQALVRLGAVTGMALDSGGSTTMAFDGTLLNRPSDGRERRISTALMLEYQGVFASEPPALVSPNGDGVDDAPDLRYRVYRPSTVTATLNGPGGATTTLPPAEQQPGSYPVPFPSTAAAATGAGAAAVGDWSLELSATDDLGRASTITRSFVVDDTLGFVRAPKRWAVPPGGRDMTISWKLARPARVGVAIVDETGRVVRGGLAPGGTLDQGDHEVVWDGLAKNGKRVAGALTVRVVAISTVGRSELRDAVAVTKAAGPRG